MKCHKCKKESDGIIPLLAYLKNGVPIFKGHCPSCEKEIWKKMKEYFMGSK